MNAKSPLSSQEVTDFMHKFSTESKKILVFFVDVQLGLSFSQCGKVEMGAGGSPLMVRPAEGTSILDSSAFVTSLPTLLQLPCEFLDPRMFKGTPFAAFFEHEVRFSFGLVFVFPNRSFLAFVEVHQ
jgi:hypothetical protein